MKTRFLMLLLCSLMSFQTVEVLANPVTRKWYNGKWLRTDKSAKHLKRLVIKPLRGGKMQIRRIGLGGNPDKIWIGKVQDKGGTVTIVVPKAIMGKNTYRLLLRPGTKIKSNLVLVRTPLSSKGEKGKFIYHRTKTKSKVPSPVSNTRPKNSSTTSDINDGETGALLQDDSSDTIDEEENGSDSKKTLDDSNSAEDLGRVKVKLVNCAECAAYHMVLDNSRFSSSSLASMLPEGAIYQFEQVPPGVYDLRLKAASTKKKGIFCFPPDLGNVKVDLGDGKAFKVNLRQLFNKKKPLVSSVQIEPGKTVVLNLDFEAQNR